MISDLQISPQRQPTAKPKAASIGVSPFLTESAYLEKSEVLDKFKTSLRGLTKTEAEKRLIEHGPNAVACSSLPDRLVSRIADDANAGCCASRGYNLLPIR